MPARSSLPSFSPPSGGAALARHTRFRRQLSAALGRRGAGFGPTPHRLLAAAHTPAQHTHILPFLPAPRRGSCDRPRREGLSDGVWVAAAAAPGPPGQATVERKLELEIDTPGPLETVMWSHVVNQKMAISAWRVEIKFRCFVSVLDLCGRDPDRARKYGSASKKVEH